MVSPVSGQIFERRLIEKYLSENGSDPVSGEPLTAEQLVEVKAAALVRPKAPSSTSIPAILKSLQDEWDAVMLHSFTLRQQLQTARQELSHALYQHDAACRVIARLTRENQQAREALATLKPQQAQQQAAAAAAAAVQQKDEPMEADAAPAAAAPASAAEPAGMTDAIVEKLNAKAKVLTGERKKRGKAAPEGLVSADSIREGFRTLASHPGLHSASVPGILSVDILSSDSSRLLTGGADKNATVFNKDDEQIVTVLKGHSKKVTRVLWAGADGDTAVTGKEEWNYPGEVCIFFRAFKFMHCMGLQNLRFKKRA